MSQFVEYFKQAELSLAAYAKNLISGGAPELAKLEAAEFSTTQAEAFILKYRVVTQHTDATGLSATVFADNVTGETFLAVRGTELTDIRDFATGVFDIMLFGSTQLHPQYDSLKAKVTEWLGNGTLPPAFTVTGHSMGGFLAAGLVDDPAFASHVSHAYLYNAPGMGGFAGPFINTVLDWMGLAPVYDQSKISNIEAATGPSPIAGLGFDVAPPIDITIEDQMSSDVIDPPDARNHSQQVLTDALAVYSTYSQLAPSLSQNQLSKLIDAFGSTKDVAGASNSKTLESALDVLRTIVLNPASGQVVLDDSQKTGTGDRDKFYTNLYALQNNTLFKSLAGNVQLTPLSDLSASDIIARIGSNSPQGLAARFALVALNPFILEGNGVDYNVFNMNDALERFDPATGTGALTSTYLVDRMAMLLRKNWFNIEDKNPLDSTVSFNSSNHSYQNINDYFEDVTTGYKVSQGELSNNTPRYYFGDNQANNPAASKVADHLYGGGGDDTLNGQKGNDYLEGGSGSDIYTINPGDGFDTVFDADGLGSVKFGTVVAKGRESVTDGKDWIKMGNGWVDEQNGLIYLLSPQANGTQDLLISYVNGSDSARVEIKNWSDDKLGIKLGGNTDPIAPIANLIIKGDLQPVDQDTEAAGIQTKYNNLGNIIVGDEAEPDRKDVLYGSGDNDLIQGFGGVDYIEGKDGDDSVDGGTGEDRIDGGSGNDVMLGGGDSDIILGQTGNDRVYAKSESRIDEAYALGEIQDPSGNRGSLLDGGLGDDTLVGDDGKDILMGGMGRDLLMGLGGDDTIEGDTNLIAAEDGWSVERKVTPNGDVTTYSREYKYSSYADTDGGDDDVIYSGAGNDWVFAQGGNDLIDSGADNDVVFGEAGNDTVLGGSGNDILNGDNFSLAASLHGDDALFGGSGNDGISGNGGNDFLSGDEGNDILNGGEGNDTLIGGLGADAFNGGEGDDIYMDVGSEDTFVAGEGHDTVRFLDANGVSESSATTNLSWSNNALNVVLDNGSTLSLSAALYGMDLDIEFAGGDLINIEDFVSKNLTTSVLLNFKSTTFNNGKPINSAYGGANADLIQGGLENDTIKGYGGNDYLIGDEGNDLIIGGSGDDMLFGQKGTDTLQGGLGADRIVGGSEADTYLFNLGDGNDTIAAAFVEDTVGDEVRLGEGIDIAALRFFKLADDSLLMRIADTQDSILFEKWFSDGANIATLRLNDNSLLTASEMTSLALEVFGGTNADDVLVGTVSSDKIEGYAGNDSFDGGAGNDLLIGGEGTDTYLFGWDSIGNDVVVESDSGQSVIALTNGLNIEDLNPTRLGNDLILAIKGGGATLTIKDYYVSSQNWLIVDHDNVSSNLSDLLALPQSTVDIQQIQAEFLDAARSQWVSQLLSNAQDVYHNRYTRLDNETYQAQLVTADETKTMTQHFKEVNTTSDLPFIQRLHNSYETSSTSVNLYGNPAPFVPATQSIFYPLATVYLVPPELSSDLRNWKSIFDEFHNLIGFMVETPLPPPVTHNYFLNTYDRDMVVEHIYGGEGDNAIEGYKRGNPYQYNDGYGQSDVVLGSEVTMIDGGSGNDTLYASGEINFSNEMYYFADVAPNLGGLVYGNQGNDLLYGNYARDYLIGGDGRDYMDGRFSEDNYFIFSSESGIDTIWDTGTQLWKIKGPDTLLFLDNRLEPRPIAQDSLQLIGVNPENIHFEWGQRLTEGVRDNSQGFDAFGEALYTQTVHATLTMTWLGGGVEIVLPNTTDLPGVGLERIQFGNGTVMTMSEIIALAQPGAILNPQDQDNNILGQDTNDTLYGEAGNDTIDGKSGNDILDGGLGNDTLIGGSGNDTYLFSRNSGYDLIDSYDSAIGKVDTVLLDFGITPEEIHVDRSGNDLILSIIGTTDKLTIKNYLLNNGITPYSIEAIEFRENGVIWDLTTVLSLLETNQAPILSLPLSDQTVTQGSSFDYVVDVGTFTDPDVDDILIYKATLADGSSLPSWLNFDADTLTFTGIPNTTGIFSIKITASDTGNLSITDIFDITVNGLGQTLNGTSGVDTLNGGAGNDTLNGLGGNDILNGNQGNDFLNGGAGNDTMKGGMGDDIYVINTSLDSVIENFNEGKDTVRSSISYTLPVNTENLNLLGTGTINGTGNELDNTLIGNSANNILTGAEGNDLLNGKDGADTLIGGIGNDSYIVDNASDTIIELNNEGIDTVRSSISFNLSENIENLILIKGAPTNGTGNASDNSIIGNDSDNILAGENGKDRLSGKAGNDTLIGGSGNDTYILGRGYGTETLIENDTTLRNLDTIRFLSDINPKQIWFQHVDNNLEVSIIGTPDKAVIKDWYLGSANHVERFRTSDGMVLKDSQVEDLVNAMSSFVVPDNGQTTLPPSYETALDPIISTLWM